MIQSSASLDTIKANVVKYILDDKVQKGTITTQEQYDIELSDMMDKLNNNQLISNPIYQTGKTNADNFNSDIENLYIDLLTAFGYVNNLDGIISKHLKINESVVSNYRTQVSEIEDKVLNLENMVMQMWGSNNFIEAFRSTNNFEENTSLCTDRYGDTISKDYIVSLDKYNESISLPYISKSNILIGANGVSFANISIVKQLGGDTISVRNERTGVDKAIDTSLETYWSETIMCDTPMNVQMNDYYYNINSGALCEIELKFDSTLLANEISLMPYAKYPMEVVAIRYYENDDSNAPIYEVVSPNIPNSMLKNKVMTKQMSFKFDNILCKRIKILLRQLHYVKSNIVTSANDSNKNQIWFSSTGETPVDIEKSSMFKPLYKDKGILDRAWVVLNKLFKRGKELTLENILAKDEAKIVMNKYEYNYGLYNVGVYFNDFQDTGVFISKPISANGNIKSLSLKEDSYMQLIRFNGVDYNICDVEYYISYIDEPTSEDWIPVFPKNKTHIDSEKLIASPEKYNRFYFRFPTTNTVTIRDNLFRTLVNGTDYTLVNDTLGNTVGIEIPFPNSNLIYTVSYAPNENSKVIDFINGNMIEPITETESIKGNNTSYYEINNLPYIINPTSIRIIDNDGNVLSQNNGEIECITNIYSPSESYKDFNNTKLQYYVDKQHIYFNRNINSESTIEFTYEHYISNVRVKAILRRNSTEYNWLTPVVDNIELNFNTMD